MDLDKILIFDLTGPMAHFRKFYTNSSALTYGFPPRTALMGIVAAILGYERDSYYEELDRGRFAVAVKVPTRRLIQTVNYVRTKREDLILLRRLGRVSGTQTLLEFLVPGGEDRLLRFRLFFAHPSAALLGQAADRLKEGRPCFPLYLGITECLATARYVNLFKTQEFQTIAPGTTVQLTSVLNVAHLELIDLPTAYAPRLVRERAPYAFGAGRMLRPSIACIYDATGKPLSVRLRVPAYRFHLPFSEGEETVAFLEG